MSAAALRPELFNHLFATKPDHAEKADLGASAISIVLHAAVLAGLVWAGSNIQDKPETIAETPVPIVLPKGEMIEPVSQTSGGGGVRGFTPAPVVVPRLDNLVDPSATPIDQQSWAEPGPPLPGAEDSTPGGAGPGEAPTETRGGIAVSSVVPRLLNPRDVQRSLERNYPPFLRDSGIGGRVTLWLLVDENGRVIETEIREKSGQTALDQAARNVGEIMRFSPATHGAQRVKIWVTLPIVFKTN